MEDLISKSAVIGKLSQGYWDWKLQQAKNDPCVIDAMIDWAIRIVNETPTEKYPTLDIDKVTSDIEGYYCDPTICPRKIEGLTECTLCPVKTILEYLRKGYWADANKGRKK